MRNYPTPGDVNLMNGDREYLKLELAWEGGFWNATFYHNHFQCNHGREQDAEIRAHRDAIVQDFSDAGWTQMHIEEGEASTYIYFERPRTGRRAHPDHCCTGRQEGKTASAEKTE